MRKKGLGTGGRPVLPLSVGDDWPRVRVHLLHASAHYHYYHTVSVCLAVLGLIQHVCFHSNICWVYVAMCIVACKMGNIWSLRINFNARGELLFTSGRCYPWLVWGKRLWWSKYVQVRPCWCQFWMATNANTIIRGQLWRWPKENCSSLYLALHDHRIQNECQWQLCTKPVLRSLEHSDTLPGISRTEQLECCYLLFKPEVLKTLVYLHTRFTWPMLSFIKRTLQRSLFTEVNNQSAIFLSNWWYPWQQPCFQSSAVERQM